MKERVNRKVAELIRKAKTEGQVLKPTTGMLHKTSLDRMIKTKEQAAIFMKLLHS